jgi:AhpD family alkylhydroperoxidase
MNRRNILSLFYLAAMAFAVLLGTSAFAQTQTPSPAPAGMPWYFQTIPDKAQAGFWDARNAIVGPNTAIPPKYQALIGLAVAAQIPCEYCVYVNTISAKKAGATEDEIRQAVAIAGITRMISTNNYGNQIDFEKFKATVNGSK